MDSEKIENFPSEVKNKLDYYVYRLIDPRNGETFYVGKGQNDRVFQHIKGDISEDELNDKLSRIREIQSSGFKVGHVIHRHGMNKETATEVEAALIESYIGLTNKADGKGNDDFGVMHVKEIIDSYCAETADFSGHKSLIIKINRSATERGLYDATRYAWKIDNQRAEEADVILAVVNGIIREVFIADEWLKATSENFPEFEPKPDRYGFKGRKAENNVRDMYKDKKIPDKYRKKGAANPVMYTWDK